MTCGERHWERVCPSFKSSGRRTDEAKAREMKAASGSKVAATIAAELPSAKTTKAIHPAGVGSERSSPTRSHIKSSGGGVEGHAGRSALQNPGHASNGVGTSRSSAVATEALPREAAPAGIKPGPPEAKSKRAPRGSFDRNEYQRELMRKRRQAEKREDK